MIKQPHPIINKRAPTAIPPSDAAFNPVEDSKADFVFLFFFFGAFVGFIVGERVTTTVDTEAVSTVAPVLVATDEVKLDEVMVDETEVASSSLVVDDVEAKDTLTSNAAVQV